MTRSFDRDRANPKYRPIDNTADVDQMITRATTLRLEHRVPLLRAARAGLIDLAMPGRKAQVPTPALQSTRPLMVLLGDDDYASTGPLGWAAWPRVARWARGAVVHASGADLASYRLAIDQTLICRRFLLIETASAHAREWGVALQGRGIPTLMLLPSSGEHPVTPPRETMQ